MGREYCTMRLGRHEQKVELCLERRIRKNGYAGFVSSKCFREDVLIVVNDGFLEDQGIRGGYITAREDGTHPMVIMTSTAFTELKQGHLSVRFFLMHELGHYYHGHLAQPPKLEDVFSEREASMNKGIVPKEELEADIFAAEAIIDDDTFLDYLKFYKYTDTQIACDLNIPVKYVRLKFENFDKSKLL